MAANFSSSAFPQSFPSSTSDVYTYFQESNVAWFVTGALIFFAYLLVDKPAVTDPKVPYGSFIHHLVPRFFSGSYYARNAKSAIDNGYRKVSEQISRIEHRAD